MDHQSISNTIPFCFRSTRIYGLNVTSIINSFELWTEKPFNWLAKSCTWSQYKHYSTAKYFISITPQWAISFISNEWGGRFSDKHIVEDSGTWEMFQEMMSLLTGDLMLQTVWLYRELLLTYPPSQGRCPSYVLGMLKQLIN